MKLIDKRLVALSALSAMCAALLLPAGVQAQAFPTKPVRVVVPFPAGGTLDSLGRQLATRMQESLGQPVVIEPRGGGATRVGTQAVQVAAPDGYTVLFMANSFVMVPMLMDKAPWDAFKDFAPVSLVSRVSQVLVVHPSFEARTLPELVKYAKAKPGQLDFASFGNGTSSHLGVELFKQMAGVYMVHIPFAGVAPALQNVLGGQVKVFFTNIPDVLPHIQGGRLRALATSDDKRSPQLPEVPSFAEQGFPGFASYSWYGMAVPAGTPEPAIRRLHEAMAFALKSGDVRERLVQQGHTILGGGPEDLRRFMVSEQQRYAAPIKRSGAKIE
jgi:tripartite-type tricarboxylate transporter receptor subunit TctC